MLPIQSAPQYTLTIPSSGKKVKFRPFLVKDQKALLIAQASDDTTTMLDTLRSIINSCVEGIANENLATFDIEYIFTQLRAKSVGEIVELKVKCSKCDHDDNTTQINLDLTTIEVERNPDHTNVIPLFDDVGVTMKYPTVEMLEKYQGQTEDVELIFELILACIENIFQGEKVFHAHEQTHEQLMQFVDNLTSENLDKIKFFFDSVPKITKTINFNCHRCAQDNEIKIQGVTSFF